MNKSKYHHVAVTEPNDLLAKILSNHEGNRFCSSYFFIFQTDATHKRQKHIITAR